MVGALRIDIWAVLVYFKIGLVWSAVFGVRCRSIGSTDKKGYTMTWKAFNNSLPETHKTPPGLILGLRHMEKVATWRLALKKQNEEWLTRRKINDKT